MNRVTTPQVSLSPQWLREPRNVTIYNAGDTTRIKVVFKEGHEFDDEAHKLKDYCKSKGFKCHIQDSFKDETKIGVFWTFKPSNEAERLWLAGKTGKPITPGTTYTFATRAAMVAAWKECNATLTAMGKQTPNANWSMGEAISNASPEGADAPA